MATPGAPAVLQDSSNGLPLTLNGASVAVTVAGVTVNPALYYATPTQIAAVLPSNTPVGTGSVTVSYNGITSAPASTKVVQSALGLATMSGDGTGQVLATDGNYNFISPTTRRHPARSSPFGDRAWAPTLRSATPPIRARTKSPTFR